MKTVYQEYETDCRAAAVAMLCDVTLDQAKAIVYNGRQPGIISSGHLLNAVRTFKGKPRADRCQSAKNIDLTALDNDALLKGALLDKGKRHTHWAVWDSEGQTIRDPYGYSLPFEVTHYVEIEWE